MKKLLALVSIFLCTAFSHANTVRVGNGGDFIKIYNPRTISLIMSSPYQLRLMVHAWTNANYNGLGHLSSAQFSAYEKVIADTPLEIQEQPCIVDGQEKAAAAYRTPNKFICVSWKYVEDNVDGDFPELQIIPLLAHEYLHIIDPSANERDATDFQTIVTRYLMQTGIPPVNPSMTSSIHSNFASFDWATWNNKPKVLDFVRKANSAVLWDLARLSKAQLSNYPVLISDKNIISDIKIRLYYLQLKAEASWGPTTNMPGWGKSLDKDFPVNKAIQQDSIPAGTVAMLFAGSLQFPVAYPNARIPSLSTDITKDEFARYLLDLQIFIKELDRTVQEVRLGGTKIHVTY